MVRQALWMSVVFMVAAYLTGPIVDPDLWWHITAGRWILDHGTVPHLDYWNLFGVSRPWRAYSWSAEVVLALVESWGGVAALYLLKLLLVMLLVGSLMFVAGSLAKDFVFGGMLGVVAAASTFNHLTLRPQTVTWILFAWLLLVAEREVVSQETRRVSLALIVLMSIWANMHLSAVIALGALFCWVLGSGATMSVLLPATIGTFLTPYVGTEWATFLEKTSHPFKFNIIAEFQSARFDEYSTAFAFIVLTFLAVLLMQRPGGVRRGQVIGGLVLLIGGLGIVKFLPFAVIFLTLLVARAWGLAPGRGAEFGNLGEACIRLGNLWRWLPREGLAFLCIALGFTQVWPVWRAPLAESLVPRQELDFILEEKLPTPILTSFGDGGYVMYRFADGKGEITERVVIDGRTNITPPEIMSAFVDASTGARDWRRYIDIVRPQTILWREPSALNSLLLEKSEWCLIYESERGETRGYTIFIRRELLESRRREGRGLKSVNCPAGDQSPIR